MLVPEKARSQQLATEFDVHGSRKKVDNLSIRARAESDAQVLRVMAMEQRREETRRSACYNFGAHGHLSIVGSMSD